MVESTERKPRRLINAAFNYVTIVGGVSLMATSIIDSTNISLRIDSQVATENPPIVTPGELASARSEVVLFDQREHDSLLATGKHASLNADDEVKLVKALGDLKQEERRTQDIRSSRVNLNDEYQDRKRLDLGLGVVGATMVLGRLFLLTNKRWWREEILGIHSNNKQAKTT